MKTHNIAIIKGDGIGHPVVDAAWEVLQAVAKQSGFGSFASAQALSAVPAPLSRSITSAVVASSMLKSPMASPPSASG